MRKALLLSAAVIVGVPGQSSVALVAEIAADSAEAASAYQAAPKVPGVIVGAVLSITVL